VSPIVAALEQVEVDLDEVIAVDAVTETGPTVSSLVEALAEVPDPREARGVRHGVLAVRLHWVRDVTFDEDRCTVRTGHGPQVMAARNLAISTLRLGGATNIAAALRHHARDSLRPLTTYKIT